jgi:Ig-like domain-containing protein
MLKIWNGVFCGALLGILSLFSQKESAFGTSIISVTASPEPSNSYAIFVSVFNYTNENGDGSFLFPATEPLFSVTNVCNGESIPFQVVITNQLLQIDVFDILPPTDALSEIFKLTWTNYTTNALVDFAPIFLEQPQSQSVFVGGNVTFTTQAIHSSGYQWQKNGTNLVEGRFIGVTNSALTISDAQPEDAGNYIVVANHPDDPASSTNAVLSVFKQLQFGMTKFSESNGYRLQISNQDHSPVDEDQISHFMIYTTTNLSLGVSNWDVASDEGILTNGIYQIIFQDDGSPSRFWEVGQQP